MSDRRRQLPPAAPPDLEEAKLDLLAWGIEADEALNAQVHQWIDRATGAARTAAPWAAGFALLSGVLFGRRKRRESGESSASPLNSIVRIAIDAAPMILDFMRSRRQR